MQYSYQVIIKPEIWKSELLASDSRDIIPPFRLTFWPPIAFVGFRGTFDFRPRGRFDADRLIGVLELLPGMGKPQIIADPCQHLACAHAPYVCTTRIFDYSINTTIQSVNH